MVVDAVELEDIRAAWTPDTWAAGSRTLYLRVRWSELTGRQLGRDWDPMASLPVGGAV
jgi:hypothetical protein